MVSFTLHMKRVLKLLSLIILLSFAFASVLLAQTATATPETRSREAGSGFARQKLDAKKLKVCQTKEKVIKNRLDSLTRLVTNQETKFDRIATRVENFYTNKVLPTGKTVSNYDALVADIDAKKATVDSALASAKTNADSFSCDSDDPKGALTQVRRDIQAVKSALHDFRKSVRNLIVAVRAVAKNEKRMSPTPAPTP